MPYEIEPYADYPEIELPVQADDMELPEDAIGFGPAKIFGVQIGTIPNPYIPDGTIESYAEEIAQSLESFMQREPIFQLTKRGQDLRDALSEDLERAFNDAVRGAVISVAEKSTARYGVARGNYLESRGNYLESPER